MAPRDGLHQRPVIRKDGSQGLNLPLAGARKVHRIAVAFGARGEVAIKSGDFGKGFVLVISEHSFHEVIGLYLFNERSFPSGPNLLTVDDTIWREVQQKPEFKRRKEADRESYAWDKLIEYLADPTAKSISEPGPQLNDIELALRAMARENRFARRLLGRGVREFLRQATDGKLRSRLLRGPGGVIYVFVFFQSDENAAFRAAEVANRCFIARHRGWRR